MSPVDLQITADVSDAQSIIAVSLLNSIIALHGSCDMKWKRH